jgi:uncharacterized protein YhbP (UPF0306 family)
MNQQQKNTLAREIVAKNQYLTIASYKKESGAWANPVAYATDAAYNFYFISPPSSQHAKNFQTHPRISMAIFDSRQPFGGGVGLQIEAKAHLLSLSRTPFVMKMYLTRRWPFTNKKQKTYLYGCQKAIENGLYRIYKFTPKKVWMNDPDSDIDRRIEVKLT